MNLSYWELKTWFSDIDYTVVGSGIVGISCAIRLKEKFPKSRVLIIEKGLLPQGASTKNAGFACFGSLSEIMDDLNSQSEVGVLNLIEKRINGLRLLRTQLGDSEIDFKQYGGYELFLDSEKQQYEDCLENISKINGLLSKVFNALVFETVSNKFQFNGIQPQIIFNKFEGQIDTGKMMVTLLKKAQSMEIKIINKTKVESFVELNGEVEIKTEDLQFKTKKLFIATNGFASQLGIPRVKPARAQVLITKPIKNLLIKGTFHINKGYYYFRNINDRILFGGGRDLDFKTETTTEFGLTEKVQHRLEELLRTTILPKHNFEIDHRWSGIMGVGETKTPEVMEISENVFCGVKLGGMGIAIGSLVGRELADFV